MNRSEFLKFLGLTAAGGMLGNIDLAQAIATKESQSKNPSQKEIDPSLAADITKPIEVAVIGAGSRGSTYAAYAETYPNAVKIVGVSDINDFRREKMAKNFGVNKKKMFGDWSELFKVPKFADAVIISTPDNLHFEPCMKALEMGYHVLLEKPIAQSEDECRKILAQSIKYDRIVGVCHVLRYAPYFKALKETVASGIIGEVISIQHLEPIEVRHMCHSYVRGNWHDSNATTPIILAKSCHDLDILRWIVDSPFDKISAFGSLRWFKKENMPKGAAKRCLDCSLEPTCPYSAPKIYIKEHRHPYAFDLPETTDKEAINKAILESLKTSNYGRCVFDMDNNQCDNYVMNMTFKNGTTVAFAMEGHTSEGGRKTVIMGTKGDIVGDMKKFTITDFYHRKKTVWEKDISKFFGYGGHAGGDWGIMKDFATAVSKNDKTILSSTIDQSVESHIAGFKAEECRKTFQIQEVKI